MELDVFHKHNVYLDKLWLLTNAHVEQDSLLPKQELDARRRVIAYQLKSRTGMEIVHAQPDNNWSLMEVDVNHLARTHQHNHQLWIHQL